VSGCCTTRGYEWVFSRHRAEVDARRYRRRGVDRTTRRILNLLAARGVAGQTVLEVGGGIGAIQLELLRAGASRATNVELIPTYEEVATALLREHDVGERVERRVADFAEVAEDLPAADVVILNRVLCCYPDMPGLAGAAAAHTRQILVISVPTVRWWTRALLGFGNIVLRLARRGFRIFLHRPRQIRATAEGFGLHLVVDRPGLLWEVMTFEAGGA
jgi:2-polyprenyl-3-methyl-5-hydroxy-6-metoxy-1,4-benzoquinol methylase